MNTTLTSLVSNYKTLHKKFDALVLASVVETMGSTYRKAGAHMLITPNDEYFGLLGGGCFEADLMAHAQEVFKKKQSKMVFYDMRAPEDEIWGLGLGCNGAVRIYLQYISASDTNNTITYIESALNQRERKVLLTVCSSGHEDFIAGQHTLLEFEAQRVTNLPANCTTDIISAVEHAYACGASNLVQCEYESTEICVFIDVITPPFHLMLIGAGPDAEPIVVFAKALDWEISLVDYRQAFLEQDAFQQVDRTIFATPETLAEDVDLNSPDAIVLMTHKIEYDERYLRQLTKSSAKYIGLLGPAARRDRLLEGLDSDAALIFERVYGPIGLDIGGERPEEIALSLVAEIQSVLYGTDSGSLHLKTKPLHGSSTLNSDDLEAVILAAGAAKRFGGLKQLLEYEGQSLLKRCIETAHHELASPVRVVLGARSQKIKRNIEDMDVQVLVNENWENGIATSLQTAIESLSEPCSGMLLMLCDQALIEPAHLKQLSNAWMKDKNKVIVSRYANTFGPPCIIPSRLFPGLMKLKGDSGAKSFLADLAEDLEYIDIPEAETDIDTQEDYMKLLSG